MTKQSNVPKAEAQAGLTVKDAIHAPIVYFDGAPNFGNVNGVVNITLAASRHLADGTNIASDVIAVAYLRCSIQAAIDLRSAIDNALLLGAKPAGQAH